jgi:hypothetical protein
LDDKYVYDDIDLSKNIKIRTYKTIILSVVLYGCETWSLTLRAEHTLRMFENRVLRRIFGPKRDEVTGGWRKFHNEELHKSYSSPSIIRMTTSRRMKWPEHVARRGEKRNAYTILVGKPRDHWEDQDVDGWTILKWILERQDGMIWIELIWLRTGVSGWPL